MYPGPSYDGKWRDENGCGATGIRETLREAAVSNDGEINLKDEGPVDDEVEDDNVDNKPRPKKVSQVGTVGEQIVRRPTESKT
jgi:hypothetical protein